MAHGRRGDGWCRAVRAGRRRCGTIGGRRPRCAPHPRRVPAAPIAENTHAVWDLVAGRWLQLRRQLVYQRADAPDVRPRDGGVASATDTAIIVISADRARDSFAGGLPRLGRDLVQDGTWVPRAPVVRRRERTHLVRDCIADELPNLHRHPVDVRADRGRVSIRSRTPRVDAVAPAVQRYKFEGRQGPPGSDSFRVVEFETQRISHGRQSTDAMQWARALVSSPSPDSLEDDVVPESTPREHA